MKQIVALVLAAVMLLTLMGCGSAGDTDTGVPEQTYSDGEDVDIRIISLSRDETGLRLEVEWINHSDREVIFGSSYAVERKEGNRWMDCIGGKDIVFDAIAYILPPKGSRVEVYYPELLFDMTKPGTYRFTSKCSTEELDNCRVWAEFTLEEEADAHMIQTNELWMNPPALKLGSVVTEMDVPYAGCAWYFLQEDGTEASVLADHADPLMMQNSIPHLTVSYSHLKLTFEKAPDIWSVTCWPAGDWAEGTADSHSVQTYDEGFLARPGAWIYAVSAEWKNDGSGYYGTAEYYLYIETETGNVNGLAR